MSNTVIEFNNVGKQYILGTIGTGTLSQDLNRWWANIRGKEDPYLKIGETNDRTQKGDSRFVWALRDINFKVEQGDVVGIIGKNGAGKSTLLKILSRVTSPTTGNIKIKVRQSVILLRRQVNNKMVTIINKKMKFIRFSYFNVICILDKVYPNFGDIFFFPIDRRNL